MKYAIALAVCFSCRLASAQLLSVEPRVDSQLVALGDVIDVTVFVADLRPQPDGILSVFADLEYDAARLQLVPDSLTFGPNFSALQSQDTSQPGVIDETGAFVTGILSLPPVPSGVGGDPEILYTARLMAIAPGQVVLRTNHPDILPLNAPTLFGVDGAIAEQQINYGVATVTIVPEPSSIILMMILGSGLMAALRSI